jgi:ABC-type branched-subunit amino acid transport system substrate-binding protein
MGSRRLLALLVLGRVSAAACGGSAAQREALQVQSEAAGQAAPATGDATAGATDYGSAAPKAGQASSGPSSAASPTPGQAVPTPVAPKPGAATGGATDEGVTANSIKVGHIGIYSGPVGSFGDDLSYAGRAVLQSINDAGGVNGRKLEVLVRDNAWDGTKGMNAARDLVERQKVFP